LKNNLNRLHSAGSQSGPWHVARERNRPTCGGTAACCARAKSAQPGHADGPQRRCHTLGAVIARHTCPGRRVNRGLTGGSLAMGSRARAGGRWEGCAGQGGKWRDSPRRSGIGERLTRRRCDDGGRSDGGWRCSVLPCGSASGRKR
jgi:hypothetical protein